MRISDWSSDVCSSDLNHLTAAIPGHVEERRVNHAHQRQRVLGLRDRRVIIGRPTDRQQPALRRDRQVLVSRFDHRPPPVDAHRPKALAKKSRSTRSEEHTSELQSLMRISYAVFCLKKKKHKITITQKQER